jgi:SulP family sulfate permease
MPEQHTILPFANASLFEEEVQKLVTEAATPVKWFVLGAEAMIDVDTTGAETLHRVITWLAARDVTVAMSRANQTTTDQIVHYQLNDLIAEERMFPTNRHAIGTFREEITPNGS